MAIGRCCRGKAVPPCAPRPSSFPRGSPPPSRTRDTCDHTEITDVAPQVDEPHVAGDIEVPAWAGAESFACEVPVITVVLWESARRSCVSDAGAAALHALARTATNASPAPKADLPARTMHHFCFSRAARTSNTGAESDSSPYRS